LSIPDPTSSIRPGTVRRAAARRLCGHPSRVPRGAGAPTLDHTCDIVVSDEADIISRLVEVDVLVTMALTAEIGRTATQIKLVQVPGAGFDRIDRSVLPKGASPANAYGHETGIAKYVIGAMLALTREFSRVDAALRVGEWRSQWAVGSEPPPA
jgi:phosphoglycerate dehydrogenase-like enzyme